MSIYGHTVVEQTLGGTEFEDGLKYKIHFSQSFSSDTLQGKSSE